MTLAEILRLSQLPRHNYDAWARRGHLPFMKLRLREGGASKFHLGHAVSIAAMKAFVDQGVDPARAGRVISELFPFIFDNAADFSENGTPIDGPKWLAYVDYGASGWGWAGGGEPLLDTVATPRAVHVQFRVDMNAIIRGLNEQRF